MLATEPTTSANWYVAAGVVGMALALLPTLYGASRHGVTVVHEAGHASVALLCGRRLQSIRLNADSSGETISVGRSRGVGVIFTLLAGYPTPSVVGLAGILAVRHDHAGDWVLALVVVLALMILLLRNLFGIFVMTATIAVLFSVHHWAGAHTASALVFAGAWFLLMGGLKGAIELCLPHTGMDDARALAKVSWLPAIMWKAVFVLAAVGLTALAAAQSWPLLSPAFE